MKQLFLAVSAQLATVPAIKWIDMEKGQTDNAELRVALKFPSALIKISFPNAEELGGGNQQVKATVQIRLVFDAVNARTSKNTPDTPLNRSLEYLTIADEVYMALQAYETPTYERFIRTSQEQENRSDGLAIVRLTFSTEFGDYRRA